MYLGVENILIKYIAYTLNDLTEKVGQTADNRKKAELLEFVSLTNAANRKKSSEGGKSPSAVFTLLYYEPVQRRSQVKRGGSAGFFESAAPTTATAPRAKRRNKSFTFIPLYHTGMECAWLFRRFFVLNVIFFRKIKAKTTFRAVYRHKAACIKTSICRRRIRRDTSKPNFFIGGIMMDTEKMEEGNESVSGIIGTPDNHVYLFLSKGMMGKVRFDISVNYPTLEESKKVLSQAVDVVQQLIAEKVLPSAGRKETSQRHRFYSE